MAKRGWDWIDEHLLVEPQETSSGELWTVKHAPKKQIEQLSKALQVAVESGRPNILLISGPSGCGKTLAVLLLSEQLNLVVSRWEPPADPDTSVLGDLEGFILKSKSYASLNLNRTVKGKKLMLVKDLPFLAGRPQLERFHSIIRMYLSSSSQVPLVLVWTPLNLADGFNVSDKLLFPPDTRRSFTQLKFNPVARSFIVKQLERIITAELSTKQRPTKELLNQIVDKTCGDLRQAIITLQFHFLHPKFKQGESKRKKLEHAVDETKDQDVSLFQLIGKILYHKERKEQSAGEKGDTAFAIWSSLEDDPVPPSMLSTFLSSEIPELWLSDDRIFHGLDALSELDTLRMDSCITSGLIIGQVCYAHLKVRESEATATRKSFHAVRRPALFQVQDSLKSNQIQASIWYDQYNTSLLSHDTHTCFEWKSSWLTEALPSLKVLISQPKSHEVKQKLPLDLVLGIGSVQNFGSGVAAKFQPNGETDEGITPEQESISTRVPSNDSAPVTQWWLADDIQEC